MTSPSQSVTATSTTAMSTSTTNNNIFFNKIAVRSKKSSFANEALLLATAIRLTLSNWKKSRRGSSQNGNDKLNKLNGQTSSTTTTTTTMPAMPKEKTISSITTNDNKKYPDNNMKESIMSSPIIIVNNKKDSTSCCNNKIATGTIQHQHQNITGSSTTTTTTITPTSTGSSNNDLNSYKQQQQQQIIGNKKRGVNDFRFGKSIGEGSFSTVYIAKDIHTNREYAIKVCDKQHIIREKKNQYIIREREAMNVMSGVPGFVSLYCTFQDTNNLYFAMTYAKNGDVLPYINKVGSFDLDCTKFYAAELVIALELMHSRGVIHRDLKPENILLDDKMHSLIADFGSAKILNNDEKHHNDTTSKLNKSTTATTTTASTTTKQQQNTNNNDNNDNNKFRERKNSFVGTAQYVSPELLKGQITTKSSDLWALGCIIYQMISGLPPFRAMSEYLIFQNILKLELQFPDGFDNDARDLVEKLLVREPELRIGANDSNDIYTSIRQHPFFNGIEWKNLRQQVPPQIYPYLPGDELRSHYRIPDHLEPGLDDKQLQRLLGLELGTSDSGEQIVVPKKSIADLPEIEKDLRLENQKMDKYNQFVDGDVILKQGLVNKRKGLFARKRMLLLTTGPRLIYVDPVSMVKKGEIPWSPELRVEPKNFKIFFIHTPNRTYYLEEPEGFALNWCRDIEDVRLYTYGHDS